MFGNFSLPELLIVGALALIVIGPKDLPRMMRSVGRFVGQAKGLARQFQDSMNDAAREADLEEFRDARKLLKGKSGVTDMLNEKLDLTDDTSSVKPKKKTASASEKESNDAEILDDEAAATLVAEADDPAREPLAATDDTPRTADAKSG